MSGNLEGVVPDSWMNAEHASEVIAYVRQLAMPGRLKQRVFAKWAMTVGYNATPGDFAYVTARSDSRVNPT